MVDLDFWGVAALDHRRRDCMYVGDKRLVNLNFVPEVALEGGALGYGHPKLKSGL